MFHCGVLSYIVISLQCAVIHNAYVQNSSAQTFIKQEKLEKQAVLTQRLADQAGDATKFTQIIKLLNKTLATVDPLSVWLLNDSYPTFEALQMSEVQMPSCIENQDNLRLELVLVKVLNGEDVNVVVFGGSNSAQGMFPVILKHWWTNVITPISGSRMNLKSIAFGGTGSTFYQFCHGIYLEENETIDLVIVESALNDAVSTVFGKAGINRSLPLEQFTRQLLDRSNKPAVFYVNFFRITNNGECENLVDHGQSLISDLYRITTFHLRCLCCRSVKGRYLVDPRTASVHLGWHSNLLGHAQLAIMLIRVVSRNFAKMSQDVNELAANGRTVSSWLDATTNAVAPLPPAVYIKSEKSAIRSPQCWANMTPDREKAVIHSSLKFRVVERACFEYVREVRYETPSFSAENVARTEAYGGFFANETGCKVKISFSVASLESEGAASTRSVGLITRTGSGQGTVEAWLDDGRAGERVRISLSSILAHNAAVMVATHVTPGRHTLTCRVVGGGGFFLIGVFVGASDWP